MPNGETRVVSDKTCVNVHHFKSLSAMNLLVFFWAVSSLVACVSSLIPFRLMNQWSQLDFQFPDNNERQRAISLRHFIPGASVPIDLEVDRIGSDGNGRIFLTIPRQGPGRAFTLATVTSLAGNGGALLSPYPDYSWNVNQGSNCDGLTSVFRVAIDECNRLWVADTGKIGFAPSCPPQLLAFDLATNKLLLRYRIPSDQLRERSLLIDPVPDVQSLANSCSNTFVYIADSPTFGLIVFDMQNSRSWRIENKEFYPNPKFGTHTIAGQSFDLMGGILALALYPKVRGRPADTLYFHSVASDVENTVSTSVIKNYTLFQNDINAAARAFQPIPGNRPTQAFGEAIDKSGRLYFGLYDPIAVYRWDRTTPYTMRNFELLGRNNQTLQFSSGVKIIEEAGREVLWLLTSRYQKFMTNTLNSSEINFRIYKAFVNDDNTK